jgi:hypothetical protein
VVGGGGHPDGVARETRKEGRTRIPMESKLDGDVEGAVVGGGGHPDSVVRDGNGSG